ncbi:hypothetical protein GCM10027049_18200 [Mucilaginibacter puniceus]
MMEKAFTIRQLRNQIGSTTFNNAYQNLILENKEVLDDTSKTHLLKIGVLFLNLGDDNLKRFGYHIILRYSILFDRYKPLYDIALNKGYIPVSKFIEDKYINKTYSDNFFHSYFSAYQDNFLEKGIYLSYGQKKLFNYSKINENNYVLVAPTSYGKSEIIVNKVGQNLAKKVCIIVPSKALLAQTKRRLLDSDYASEIGRIISHPEMYRGDETNFVAVLTQERLLRLLQKNEGLVIDVALVDEAHNLLKNDSRGILLAQVIMILTKRNPEITFNFFSPFISDGKNLKIPYSDYQIEDQRTAENIKVEKFFLCNFHTDRKLRLYDQFLNQFFDYKSKEYHDELGLIMANKAKKNIIYFNRPRHVELFAKNLSEANSNSTSLVITDIIATIADFLHPEYTLLKCLKNGVVYHHGGMPELIRLYVENVFTTNNALTFIVTNSTLLEGVNIPAEKIFLLTTKIGRRVFSKSQFRNLIGRVCRFSEIFNRETGNLKMLEPEVYLLKSSFEDKDANHETFIIEKAKTDITFKDDVDNLLLKDPNSELSPEETQNIKDAIEYLENIEPNTVANEEVEYAKTEIGRLCYKNNVEDFIIKEVEDILDSNYKAFPKNRPLDNANDVIDAIYKIFISGIENSDKSVSRLQEEKTRNFYSMFLSWRTTSSSYKEMIAKFMGYWEKIENKVIFFGSTWGEDKRNETDHIPLYINLNSKSNGERINLAILKIKDEQDYVEFKLLKYIDILAELGLIENNFYERIKYGSADPLVISLLKNGFSIELAKIIVEKPYADLIQINTATDEILINEFVVELMEENLVNKILIFEIKHHIRYSQK